MKAGYSAFDISVDGLAARGLFHYFIPTSWMISPSLLHLFANLPKNLQRIIVDTTTDVAGEVGRMWDAADAPGKDYLVREGATIVTLSAEENAKFKSIAEGVVERRLAELEAKGLAARDLYAKMKTLAEKFSKDSNNFWVKR